MKKAKKPTSRAAKKAPTAKKKSAPVKAAAKKKAAAAKPAKKVAAKPAKKVAKKPEPKAKKALTTAKKVVEKVLGKVAAPAKGKKPEAKAKPEKEPKAPKKAAEPKAIEPEPAQAEEIYEEAEVYLTDAEGRRYCRTKDCDQIAMVDGYCRYHYLLFWKKIQVRKKILTEGKLERYIEDLTARYPDKYLEMLRKDLRTEKDFTAAITELEIDDTAVDSEYEDEAQSYLDEVRGHSGEGAGERDEEGF